MLGQNQKWKQSRTQAEFSMLIISLHLIITCRTCCHGFGSKLSPRLKWKTKKPQAEQSAETSTESYAPQDGVQQQRNPNGIQMAIQYRIAPFMYLWHLWYLLISIQQYSSIFDPCCGIFMPSPQRPDNAMRRTPGTLRMRPNKAKILLWRVLTSPRQQKPIKSPMKPERLAMIGKAMAKPKLMLAWNHATCAIPQITPETNEGRTSWRGIWLCFLCVTT